ncbi:MAG: rhomboid family intramembrane serine protease [Rhodobacteraceae bacterium]|nr:rhomboid family intramembrane serine protease [Paracoccaceae bacterium]
MEPTQRKRNQAAFNPVSPIVVVLVVAIVGIELVFQAAEHGLIGGPLAGGWRIEMMRFFGFHKAVFDHIVQGGEIEPKVVWPFLSYLFIHQSFMQMLIVSALILAMGKMISEMFSGLAVLVLFVVCGLAGALVFGLYSKEGGFPLSGAYPVFYGFIGTYTWIQIYALRAKGLSILPAFSAVGMFIVLRSGFALYFGVPNDWMADLTGLLTGFFLAFILAPDGKDRIKGWVRALRAR